MHETEIYYKKSELQLVFTKLLNDNPGLKEELVTIWNRIKGCTEIRESQINKPFDYKTALANLPKEDQAAQFANELPAWIYFMMTAREVTGADAYWYQVSEMVGKLAEKYGGADTLPGQWATVLMWVAEDVIAGRRKMPGEWKGVLDEYGNRL